MRSTRVLAVAAAVLLATLIAGAVTLSATTDSPDATSTPAHLDVGPGPLRTATGVLTFTDASGLDVTAPCAFDFAHRTAEISATASFSFASISIDLRVVAPLVYLSDGALTSLTGAPWVVAAVPRAAGALGTLGETLRHPDLSRLHATAVTGVTSPTSTTTTTTLRFAHVTLPSTSGLPITLPSSGHLVAVVTTGAQGQVLRATAHLWNPTDDVHAALLITGYDVPVKVAAPPHDQVAPLTAGRVRQIFGTNAGAVQEWLRRLGITSP